MDATDPFIQLISSLLVQYSSLLTENQQLRAQLRACTDEFNKLSADRDHRAARVTALEGQLARYAPAPPTFSAPALAQTLEPTARLPTPHPLPQSWAPSRPLFQGNGAAPSDGEGKKKEDRRPRSRAA